MSANNVNGLLGVSMDKIKEMVDVNTVVGDPITTPEGTTVIPISRVNYGFAASGGLFAGGSGGGVTVSPVAFLSIHNGNVRVIQIEPYFSPVDRALEKIPDIADMLGSLFKKEKEAGEIVQEPARAAAETEEKPAE